MGRREFRAQMVAKSDTQLVALKLETSASLFDTQMNNCYSVVKVALYKKTSQKDKLHAGVLQK